MLGSRPGSEKAFRDYERKKGRGREGWGRGQRRGGEPENGKSPLKSEPGAGSMKRWIVPGWAGGVSAAEHRL